MYINSTPEIVTPPPPPATKNFTIVFPTRGRRQLLDNLLASLQENTKDLAQVEIFIAYDDDDAITKAYIPECPEALPIRWFQCKQSTNFSRDYYSMMAKESSGRWIIVCNDDVEFQTKNWDIIAADVLSKAVGDQANVIYGFVEDNLGRSRLSHYNEYTCFPVLGRDGVFSLGYVFPDRIPVWGADIWARFLYDQVRKTVKIPIMLNHFCHHNGTREQDEINKRVQRISPPGTMQPTNQEINTLIKAIRRGPNA